MHSVVAKRLRSKLEVALTAVASLSFAVGVVTLVSWFCIFQIDRRLFEKTKSVLFFVSLLSLFILFFTLTLSHVMADFYRAQAYSEGENAVGSETTDSVFLYSLVRDVDVFIDYLLQHGYMQFGKGGYFMIKPKDGSVGESARGVVSPSVFAAASARRGPEQTLQFLEQLRALVNPFIAVVEGKPSLQLAGDESLSANPAFKSNAEQKDGVGHK